MSEAVLIMLLAAALGHAVWNAVSRRVPHRDQFYTVANLAALVLYAPVVILVARPWRIPAHALPWLLGSILFEIAYFLCLAQAYRSGEFLTAYPVARGSSPLFTTFLSVALFADRLSILALGGVALVVIGIFSLNGLQLIRAAKHHRQTLRWALMTGFCTACYSICDSRGVKLVSPVLWVYSVFAGIVIGKFIVDRVLQPHLSHWVLARRYLLPALVGGALMFGVSAVVIDTMRTTDVALVATVREISIVFASLIGAIWLKEKMTWTKAISLAIIIGGVVLIAL